MSNYITLQEKVLSHLHKVAKESNLDFVHQPYYSSSGTIYLQDNFHTVLSFAYHFDSYIKIQFFPEGVQTKMGWGEVPDNCILNVITSTTDLPDSIEKMEKLIRSKAVPHNECQATYHGCND